MLGLGTYWTLLAHLESVMDPWSTSRPTLASPDLSSGPIKWNRVWHLGKSILELSPSPIDITKLIRMNGCELNLFFDSGMGDHMVALVHAVNKIDGDVRVVAIPEVMREVEQAGRRMPWCVATYEARAMLGAKWVRSGTNMGGARIVQLSATGEHLVPLNKDRLIAREMAMEARRLSGLAGDKRQIFLRLSADIGLQHELARLEMGRVDFRVPMLTKTRSPPRIALCPNGETTATVSMWQAVLFAFTAPHSSLG